MIPSRSVAAIEIFTLIAATLLVCGHILDFDPMLRPPGVEFPALISVGALAAHFWQLYSTLPLWNPLIGLGEPMFESFFSFLLNPFMIVPILALGAINGAKVAIVLHVALAGMGGWALARSLRLGWVSRLLLGLLLLGAGSMVAPTLRGFFQMALSLAYMPWIYAGLFNTLRYRTRAGVGLLVVSTLLMMSAGTFWFVVPTVLGCALIVTGELASIALRYGFRALQPPLHALGTAVVFVVSLGLVVFLPRIMASRIHHPVGMPGFTLDIFEVARSYFVAGKIADTQLWFGYHHLIPWGFALAMAIALVGALVITRKRAKLAVTLLPQMYIPAGVFLLILVIWAQGNTPIFQWLYENTPLVQWRDPVRVLAAGAPIVALLMAAGMDDTFIRLRARARWLGHAAVVAASVGTIWVGVSSAETNWNLFQLTPVPGFEPYHESVELVRELGGSGMVSLKADIMLPEMAFYTHFVRSPVGNPDVFTRGAPSTLGMEGLGPFGGEFAMASAPALINDTYPALNMQPVQGTPVTDNGSAVLWRDPYAAPYAFIAAVQAVREAQAPFSTRYVEPVTYFHRWDEVEVLLPPLDTLTAVVITEVAYPGWAAVVDGRPAVVESVGSLTGVRVNPGAEKVVFTYRAPWFSIGAALSGIVLVIFAIYLLRLDLRVQGHLYAARSRNPFL